MEMPQPVAGHRRLELMAGVWSGTEALHPSPWSPEGSVARGRVKARVALGGFAVILDYEQEASGRVAFTGHAVVTWDDGAGEVVMHWYDCLGAQREEFRGPLEGNRLTLTSRTERGLQRLVYTYAEGEMNSHMEMSSDDGETWSKLFDGVYQRAD